MNKLSGGSGKLSLPTYYLTDMKIFYRCLPFLKNLVLVVFLLVSNMASFGQNPTGTVKGKVVDSANASSLASATIQFFEGRQKKLINGILTSATGDFSTALGYRASTNGFNGSLVLGEVKAQGKKPMAAADWARGVQFEPGERLGS